MTPTEPMNELSEQELDDLRIMWACASPDEVRRLVAMVDALTTRLREAEEEIARHHKDFQKWEDMADRAVKRAERAEAVVQACREWGEHTPRRITRALAAYDASLEGETENE